MSLVRGHDPWAGADSRHLDDHPETKRKALKMKNRIVRSQIDRVFVKNGIRPGSEVVNNALITTKAHLDAFCEKVLEELDDFYKIIFLESRGDSDCWLEKRNLDGRSALQKNEESGGVMSVTIRMRPMKRKESDAPDLMAFIHIGRILVEECGGRPILPTKLAEIITHPHSLFVGENVARHLMRLENSFFGRINGAKYLGLTDLVNRWERAKRDSGDRFYVDPSQSVGVLRNFHRVFKGETYFKNAFESFADWNVITAIREQQLIYALQSVWATAAIFDEVTSFFEEWGMQLSIMFTIFPRRACHERRDEILIEGRERNRFIPVWYGEWHWPSGKSSNHPSCGFGFGDPEEIRKLQRADWEESYGDLPSDRQQLKKRRLDSDVSDADRVDEHRDDGGEDDKKEKAFKMAKQIVHFLHSDMSDDTLRTMMKLKEHDEFHVIAGFLKFGQNRGPLKRILEFIANRWPSDRKTRLIESAIADGHLKNKHPIGIAGMLKHMNHHDPEPRLFLLFKAKDGSAAEFYASLHPSARRKVMDFLSKFLNARNEERMIQLESFPLFRRDTVSHYVWRDEDVGELIQTLARAAGDTPTPPYFRHMRSAFVETLIEHGANARVTVKNAVKQAIAFAGPDIYDQNDMVSALAKWKSVAEEMKKETNVWAIVPQFYRCDPNLVHEPECRVTLHQNQTLDRVFIITSSATLEQAKSELSGTFVHVYMSLNKNPRVLSDIPSIILFKTPGSRPFGVFAQEIDRAMLKDLLLCIAKFKVATRFVKATRALFKKFQCHPGYLDLSAALIKQAGGKTNEAISMWVWGIRFCPITREEWMEYPLNPLQEQHIAYYMELMDKAIEKLGYGNIPRA